MRSKISQLVKFPPKYLLFALGIVAGLAAVYMVLFYHRPITFSYGGTQCFRDITILPKIFQTKGDGTYQLHYAKTTKLKGYPLLSQISCISAKKTPQERSAKKIQMAVLGISVPNKRFNVTADGYPSLDLKSLEEKISVRNSLQFNLDRPDKVFNYQITNEDRRAVCNVEQLVISCSVEGLGLEPNKTYSLIVQRYFGDEPPLEVVSKTVLTADPVIVSETSIVNGATVYDKPNQLVIKTNKILDEAKIRLRSSGTEIPAEVQIKGQDIYVKLSQDLARNADFELEVMDAIATDKGVLFEPYKLNFRTSGGPRVVSVNIGTSSVENNQTVIISFDQVLAKNQSLGQLVSFEGVQLRPEIRGHQLHLIPTVSMPLCAKFNIKLNSNFTNEYGVGGDSAWSISSRVRCYTIASIGSSVQGRGIFAWRFGSGATKYIYVANMHGDEKSTKYLLDRWIQEVDANFDKVSADKTIIIIPSLNPDGFTASSRRNAGNVDLNRNFPANDWKKDVTMPGGQLIVGGGGATALSEPESQAIANFIISEKPRLVLTYHSVASIVSGNSTGDADALALRYASLSGYRYSAFGEEDTIFHYDTTGAMETWLHDKIGIPTILVELGSSSQSEFTKNRAAMWAMLQ